MHLTVKYIFHYIITTTIAAYSVFCGVFSILPLYALSSTREKDDQFVFNTTTDGSVSLPSTPSWKSEREYSRKKKSRAQIAGSSAATYPRGKIKEVQHLFESQESYNYK